jgi:hypothetical protein
VARRSNRWPEQLGLVAVATLVMVLLCGACTSAVDREQAMAARDIAAWPLRGNLTGDHALLNDARTRLDAEGREPGRLLLATRAEDLTLFVAETKAEGGSFIALYGRTGTPVRAMRLVDLGKPTDASSLSLGIDNTIAAVAVVVPAPNVTRVAIKAGLDAQGQPVMVDVPIRDGVAALPLKGQRPANTLIELEAGGQVVGTTPELHAFDVDDPVKAQPNFKPQPETENDAATPSPSESYRTDYLAVGSFIALVALGVAAWLAANRLRDLSVHPSRTDRPNRRSPAALAAVALVLVTPLVHGAASAAMAALAYSAPSFDASAPLLQFVPAVLVSTAAVRCARAGLREVQGQTGGRALALSATVLAYLVAGLLLAALLYVMVMLGQGG